MKRSILIFFCTISLVECTGQHLRGEPRTKKQFKREEENHNCIETSKYNPEERRKFYPFNTASVIKIVSFDNLGDSAFAHSLPIKDREIDFSRITENKTLSSAQIDALTNILYNVTYKGKIFYLWGTSCYNPRNAILFYDSNDHLLEFIELCFECHEQRLSSDKIEIGDLCDQKSDLLKKYFLKTEIEIGTIREFREH